MSSVKLPLNLHCTIQIDWLGMINDHNSEYFKWEYLVYCLDIHANRSDEGLTLETSAFLPFTVANLRFQPSCLH